MKYDYVVAQDGSGDFRTIQEAIGAAVRGWPRAISRIKVKPGEYDEQISWPGEYLTLEGGDG